VVHGRFIAANLEKGTGATSNHYFSNLVGLLALGTLFRGADEADGWRVFAAAEIARENAVQTGADGVDYEASIAYHRLMTEMAIAALTKRIRLGQAANILTWHHPVRIAEQAAMLDVISGGRLDFGMGRGYQPRETEVLGGQMGATIQDQERNRAYFEEAYEIILKCWTQDSFSHHGEFFTIPPSYTRWNHQQTIAYFSEPDVGRSLEEVIKLGAPDMYSVGSPVLATTTKLRELQATNERTGPLFKMDRDPRVTRVGRFLRETSLDELPQLINVLRGEMSLVGPRPALPSEAAQFDQRLLERTKVPPGVTGMWQVEARDNPSFSAYRRLDLFYVDNWSISLDFVILIATVEQVVAKAVRSISRRKPVEDVVDANVAPANRAA